MNDLRLICRNNEPTPKDKKVIRAGMLAYHASQGHIRKEKDETISVIIKNQENKTVGGIVVSFRWGAMHIETLWIDKTIRNKGWGKKLIETVEKEAIKRKCHLSYTDTYTWQVPKFYEKLGYSVYGKLNDFPKENSLTYYAKRLDKQKTARVQI